MKPHPEELETTKDTLEALDHWKAERGAVILAHNYQLPEVQDLADFSGDSLELAFSTMNSETSSCRDMRSRARSIARHSEINAIFRPRRSVL